MLLSKKSSKPVVYILNRTQTSCQARKIPYKLWNKEKLETKYLKIVFKTIYVNQGPKILY